MKVLILAGGLGSRLSEETYQVPKPMVQIGGKPILWHIMKIYSHHGFNDFVVLCGYKSHVIKEYFSDYFLNNSSVVFDLRENKMEILDAEVEPWRVTLLETGLNTMTGGRIKRAEKVVGREPFLLTYGDGVSNVDIQAVVESHKASGKSLTLTAVQPEGRFGALAISDQNTVTSFVEKPRGDAGWINGGFFVCQPEVFDYIKDGDPTIFERAPLENLAQAKQINCYKHEGFWKPMDNLSDKNFLNARWESGEARWKLW